jgi:hypothetical protein
MQQVYSKIKWLKYGEAYHLFRVLFSTIKCITDWPILMQRDRNVMPLEAAVFSIVGRVRVYAVIFELWPTLAPVGVTPQHVKIMMIFL